MSFTHVTDLRNDICDSLKTRSGSNAKVKILASNDIVLASFTVNFGTASDGSIAIVESDVEVNGAATGTPAKWQLTTSADAVVLTGSDLTGVTISPASITQDQAVRLETFSYTAPA